MKEAFEEFAENKGWFWFTMIVIAAVAGYVVNMYWNLTWGIIHAVLTLAIGALIYGISNPREYNK